jgi:DNA polymerase-3 subunit gamma/tau
MVRETFTEGSLALAEEALATETTTASGPQIVPSLTASAGESNTDEIRSAVAQALSAGGHATAAVLIEDGKWIIEGSSVRIEVNAKPTMIRLTYNAAAEKLIRQALSQAGAPTRFMIVPGEGLPSSGSAPKVRAPLGSIENEARAHPLVVQAQSLFNAEIVTVVDLREK